MRAGFGVVCAAAVVPLCACFVAKPSLAALAPRSSSAAASRSSRPTCLTMAELVHTLDDKVIRGPLQPVSNFILVKIRDSASLTTGGIVLPDQSIDKPSEGEVVATGPGRSHPHTAELIPMCVAPGQRVMYSKYSGKKVKYDGLDHTLITDDDLLLVYEGEKPTAANLKMIRDQVLVKITRSEGRTDTGIVISAQTAGKELKSEGQVVAVGPGRTASNGQLTPCYVQPGEFVKFREYAGIEITLESESYAVVRMVDCLSKWSA
ncbi:chaperonin [Tribonema minus]|uniref:20 kDa chaperonin, chloroplastic n=1 Tax=Tribonema minus TaxID=303371 RepID=A0A835YHA6_9STRA|nr:chaperonin [Tribonema minus]